MRRFNVPCLRENSRGIIMSAKITGDMTFFEVMRMYPQAVAVLQKHNLGCIGCMGAQNESLTQGANAHGLNIDELLKDLNAAVA